MKRMRTFIAVILAAAISVFAQSEGAYDIGGFNTSSPGSFGGGADVADYKGLLDPARFKVNHAMSFYAGGSSAANVKSQSVYSTMMQYKFNTPVVLSLNFDMPLHSTFNQYNNFNSDNLSSMDYFRNMPIDASLTWMPADNVMFRVSVIRMPETSFFHGGFHRADRYYRGW